MSHKINLDKKIPLSVGSILTKDTSMDGERMTVSDEESVAESADARIANTGASELKVNITVSVGLVLINIYFRHKKSPTAQFQSSQFLIHITK